VNVRLIIHPRMEGRLNMAIDGALAEACGAGAGPVIRLYGWSPPALSLGRFQHVAGLLDRELLAADGVSLVRRPTGGHAVLHDNELTYAVALSRSEAERLAGSARKRAVYAWIARLLLAGLANLGVRACVNEKQAGDLHNPDCFGSAGEYEIAGSGGRKLVGSAQMTTRASVLQHGSIPIDNPGRKVFRWLRLEAPPGFQEPTSLAEETGRALAWEEVREAFARAARDALSAIETRLSQSEEQRARELLAATYATDAWNLRC
jgi:lipoate-protein ligase A